MSKRGREENYTKAVGKKSSKKKINRVHTNPFAGATASMAGGKSHVSNAFQGAVAQAVIQEKKRNAHFVDLAYASYAMDTTGAIVLLATIAQGASQSQRVGKKALYKSVQFRGNATAGSTGTLQDGTAMIVYDRDPTGVLPNITDILNTVTSVSFNNDTNSDRFKIVRRWDMCFAGNSATPTTGLEIHSFDEYVDLRNMEVQFGNLATGAIGDIKKGALYFVTCGAGAAGTAAPIVNMGARIRFIDLE